MNAGQFKRGNLAAATHGGYSRGEIERTARNARRRFCDAHGVRVSDLDGFSREWLIVYSLAKAKSDLLPPDSPLAWTAHNAVTRALRQLQARLSELGLVDGRGPSGDPAAALRKHVERGVS